MQIRHILLKQKHFTNSQNLCIKTHLVKNKMKQKKRKQAKILDFDQWLKKKSNMKSRDLKQIETKNAKKMIFHPNTKIILLLFFYNLNISVSVFYFVCLVLLYIICVSISNLYMFYGLILTLFTFFLCAVCFSLSCIYFCN